MDGGPARAVEQVEADDAIGVDVRVPGYGVGFVAEEDYFGGLGGGELVRVASGEGADGKNGWKEGRKGGFEMVW